MPTEPAGPGALRFYFDYISHNAYLAWTQVGAVARRHHLALEPVPVLFAGLLDAHGQKGPAEIPAKIRWMTKDVLRKSARLGVRLRPPATHPFNPLLALRVSCLDLEPRARERLVWALFEVTWAESLDVSDPATVVAALERVGLDGGSLVAAAGRPEAKARLRENTDHAIARGVFGVPTLEAGREIFWGLDDLGHLEDHLEGRDPVTEEALAAWAAVRPSAARRKR